MRLEEIINSYVVEDDPVETQRLSKEIGKTSSLLELVRALQDPLTQEDGAVRAKATQCLADVVHNKDDLQERDTKVLTVFFANRLEDAAAVGAAAAGLAAVANHAAQSNSTLATDADFWEKLGSINMLSLDPLERYKVFLLLKTLSQYPTHEFIDTFIGLASGEKDPRNLMVSLSISRSILSAKGSEIPEEKRAEIYDITFCYFPVKFHPPKDMPYDITADEIRDELRKTLASSEIAPWVIPGLISKLAAVSVSVKLDSLMTLLAVVKSLKNAGTLDTYWKPIWQGLKFEIIHGSPESETFEPVIAILSEFTSLTEFLDEVKQELAADGSAAKNKLSQLSRLVIGISVTEDIWQTLAPPAVEMALEDASVLNLFLAAPYPIPLADQVFQALLVTLSNGDKKTGIAGLKLLAQNPHEDGYVPHIVETLVEEKAYDALASLAKTHTEEVRVYCVPQLLTELPQSLGPLGEICCTRPLVHVLTVRLLSRMDFSDLEPARQYLHTLIVASSHLHAQSEFLGYDRILLPRLFEKLIKASTLDDDTIDAACVLAERAARGVVRESQSTYAKPILDKLGNLHLHIVLSSLAAMSEFPFSADFIESYALPKLKHSQGILQRAAILRLIALTANKWPEALPGGNVESFSTFLRNGVESDDVNALEAFAWLTKGLLFKADALGFNNANWLTHRVLVDPRVLRVYGVLISPDRVVTKENGCIVRNLFRQRLFLSALSVLSSEGSSVEALGALSSLLKFTPYSGVKPKFDEILPLLISSLRVESPRIQATSLNALLQSLPESAPLLSSQLNVIVPLLLNLSKSGRSVDTRVIALRTIIALKEATASNMDEFRTQITDELIPVLGDKKREVRKYAVKARQLFF